MRETGSSLGIIITPSSKPIVKQLVLFFPVAQGGRVVKRLHRIAIAPIDGYILERSILSIKGWAFFQPRCRRLGIVGPAKGNVLQGAITIMLVGQMFGPIYRGGWAFAHEPDDNSFNRTFQVAFVRKRLGCCGKIARGPLRENGNDHRWLFALFSFINAA